MLDGSDCCQPESAVCLCGKIHLMLFKRCENTQTSLQSPGIIVENIIIDHSHQGFPAGNAFAILTLTLQATPEALHRPIVNALANTGHTLDHSSLFQLRMERPIGVLEPSVAME